MKKTSDGKVTEEYLTQLEQSSTKYPRPWQMGVSSHVMAALVRELRELRKQRPRTNPSVMSDENGHLTAVWLDDNGILRSARSIDGGNTWQKNSE